MSDQPKSADHPTTPGSPNCPRTRFQQPGGLPPIGSARGSRSAEPFDELNEPELSAELPDADFTDSTAESEPPPRPFPPEVILYAAHPPMLIDRLRALYDQAALSASPPPTRWDLGVKLTVTDADVWDRVQAATAESLTTLVPLTLRVIAVAPIVYDRQAYAVGWTIDPDSLDEVRRARASVIGSIQAIVPDLALRPLDPAVAVADDVPALAFPTLIAAMQHDFAPFSWSIESITFVDSTSLLPANMG